MDTPTPSRWTGRRVLVTGGTRGIGRALVAALLARGATVVATGASPHSVAQAAADCPLATWRTCDLRDATERRALAGSLADGVDDAILNAGVQQLRDFTARATAEALSVQDEVDINLVGTIELSRGLLPALRAGAAPSPARLVIVTSGLALAPKRSSPVYCATKAGQRAFAKALRAQLRDDGRIRVIEALPPMVDTDMTRGRGRHKMTAEAVAARILAGMDGRRDEVPVGATALLPWLLRLSPALAERLMINR